MGSGKTGKGNRYLKAVLGDAAAGAGKTKTFLGERHRRILRRRGKLKAVVATARSTLVIVYNLLANPGTRYNDLGEDYFHNRIDQGRRIRKSRTPARSPRLRSHPLPPSRLKNPP